MKALICWEYGMGLGHLTRIKCLIQELEKRNVEVFLVTRDLHKSKLFDSLNVKCFPAPTLRNYSRGHISISYSDMLAHIGYSDLDKFKTYLRAWKNIIDLISPNIIFMDHSPTALLASRESGAVKISFGNTFSIPSKSFPLGLYQQDKESEAIEIENVLVSMINKATSEIMDNKREINSLYELFEEYQYNIFCSEPVFDHYPRKLDSSSEFYIGTLSTNMGEDPIWPMHHGRDKKIFAYLKSGNYLVEIINAMILSDASCILYVDGSFNLNTHLPSNISIVKEPLNITGVLKEADLFIGNGGLNTTSQFIKESKPVLLWPLQMEQSLFVNNLINKSLAKSIVKQNHNFILNSINNALDNSLPNFTTHIDSLSSVIDKIIGDIDD